VLDRDIPIRPGKTDLLEGIARPAHSAAAARLRMSYSGRGSGRLMNRCFRTPLVAAAEGSPAARGSRR
jgi:molybdenum-dependent DNA-binding transcriptional regulator ModE